MTPEATALIHAAGWVNLIAAVFHLGFWRLFRWPQSLGDLNRVNRGTLYTMNWSLAYLFGLMAFMFLRTEPGPAPAITAWLLLGMSGFYLLRAAVHPVYFRLANPISFTIFLFALAASALHYLAARSTGGL
jgi:hypothetical protein